MNLNRSTALTLRAGIVLGMVLMVIGLIVESTGGDDAILHTGILILIVSPFLGVIVSFVSLLSERDWTWAIVAGILIIITAVGILMSL